MLTKIVYWYKIFFNQEVWDQSVGMIIVYISILRYCSLILWYATFMLCFAIFVKSYMIWYKIFILLGYRKYFLNFTIKIIRLDFICWKHDFHFVNLSQIILEFHNGGQYRCENFDQGKKVTLFFYEKKRAACNKGLEPESIVIKVWCTS